MSYNATILNVGVGGAAVKQFTDGAGAVSQAMILQTQDGSADPIPCGFTNPYPVQGSVADFGTDVANSVKVGGVYNAVAPTASTGQRVPMQMDVNGAVKVNIVAGAAAGGTSSNFGSAFPGSGTAVGFLNSAGTLMAAGNLDASGNLKVNVASGSVQAVVDNVTAATAGASQALPIAFVYNDSISSAVSGDFALPRITANRQIRVVVDASTNGGLTRFSSIMPAAPAKNVLKASAGQIGFINVVNLNATPVYLRFWDALTGSVTLGTTASTDMFIVPGNTAGAGFNIAVPQGLAFTTGIISAVTNAIGTTDNTSIAANTVALNIGYA